MIYRDFGKTGHKVSVLGFGTMRLPVIDGDDSRIDESAAIELIRSAIDLGVNYIDTAYTYHSRQSELVVAKALAGEYRRRVLLATKLPPWQIRNVSDMDAIFSDQLKRLNTGQIDCYLLHGISGKAWQRLVELGVVDWLDRRHRAGDVACVGFSFHDEISAFRDILTAYEWDFCQIQYNYIDLEFQAGRDGLTCAAARGIPVVVMEPLRGGQLSDPAPRVAEVFRLSGMNRSPATWALLWLWSQPGIATVLSGMNAIGQVRENIAAASAYGSYQMSGAERAVFEAARSAFLRQSPEGCTGCRYCMPCPASVLIPENLKLYANAMIHSRFDLLQKTYTQQLAPGNRAEACRDCARCEDLCPQGLPIRELFRAMIERISAYEKRFQE